MRNFRIILLALTSISGLASAMDLKLVGDHQSSYARQQVEKQQAEIVSLNEIIQALTEVCDSGDIQTKWEIKKLEAQRNSLLDQLSLATNQNQAFVPQLNKRVPEKAPVSNNTNNKTTAVWEETQTVESLDENIQMLKILDPHGTDQGIQWEIKKYELQRDNLLNILSPLTANDEALAYQLSEKFEKESSVSINSANSINNTNNKTTAVQEETQTVESLNESIQLYKVLDPQGTDEGIQWEISKLEAKLNSLNFFSPLTITSNDEALARQISERVEEKSPFVQVEPQIVPSAHETITDIIQQQNSAFEESERQDRAKAKIKELETEKKQIEEQLEELQSKGEAAQKEFNTNNKTLIEQIASFKKRIEVAKTYGSVDPRMETRLSELEALLNPKTEVFLESQEELFLTLAELNEKKDGIQSEIEKIQS